MDRRARNKDRLKQKAIVEMNIKWKIVVHFLKIIWANHNIDNIFIHKVKDKVLYFFI